MAESSWGKDLIYPSPGCWPGEEPQTNTHTHTHLQGIKWSSAYTWRKSFNPPHELLEPHVIWTVTKFKHFWYAYTDAEAWLWSFCLQDTAFIIWVGVIFSHCKFIFAFGLNRKEKQHLSFPAQWLYTWSVGKECRHKYTCELMLALWRWKALYNCKALLLLTQVLAESLIYSSRKAPISSILQGPQAFT